MITHSDSSVSGTWSEEENQVDIEVAAELVKETKTAISVHRIFKWFAAIVAVLLSAVALAPATFKIPTNLQPWVFLIAIFWALAFCAGMFDL